MVLTTGYNFDGYKITSYLNVVSAEVVLGTGIFSSLGSQFADFTGSRKDTTRKTIITNICILLQKSNTEL